VNQWNCIAVFIFVKKNDVKKKEMLAAAEGQ
jgi:hypothetical protein